LKCLRQILPCTPRPLQVEHESCSQRQSGRPQREQKDKSDGARGFISSTKEHAPDALIVLDHFHVKKYLNDAVDQVRK